jgi:HK97 family phage portal protein
VNLKFWKKNKIVSEEPVKKTFTLENGGGWKIYGQASNKKFKEWKATWVNTAITVRGENLANGNITLYQGTPTKKVEVQKHPFLDLLNTTNVYKQSMYDIMFLLSQSLDVYGKAFLYAVAGTNGTPAELRFLPTASVKIIFSKNEAEILGYEYYKNGASVSFSPEEIIYFKIPDLESPFGCAPTITSCKDIIEIENIQQFFQKKFVKNGGNITEVITPDDVLSDEEYARLENAMADLHDVNNDVSYFIAPAKSKYDKVKTSAEDLDFIEGKKQTRAEILGKMRVPEILVGGDSANYATAKMQLNAFIETVIKPFSKFIVNQFNDWIKETYNPSLFIEMEWNTTDPRDDVALYQMLVTTGAVDPEEIRPIYGFGKRQTTQEENLEV